MSDYSRYLSESELVIDLDSSTSDIDNDDSVFEEEISHINSQFKKSDLNSNNSTPILSTRSSPLSQGSISSLVFEQSDTTPEECQDILDSHIEKTIDKMNDDGVECYRPVSQESYGMSDTKSNRELLKSLRRKLLLKDQPSSASGESDSAYSGSPSPPKAYHPSDLNLFSVRHSNSDEYIPNQPFSSHHLYITDQTAVCPDLMFTSTKSPPAYTNHHIQYLPPVWAQLHQLKENLQQDSQISNCSSQSSGYTVHHIPAVPQIYEPFPRPPPPYTVVSRSRDSVNTTPTSCTIPSSTWRMQCKECKKRFNSTINLENHIDSVHKGIRPFKCNICDKTFAQRATLRTHLRTHTGEKPYKCDVCSRRFADLSTCKKHQRVHDGQKPYECDVCGKCFSQSGNMLRHKEGHTKKDRISPVGL